MVTFARWFLCSFLQKGSAEWYEGLIAWYKPEEGVSVRSFSSEGSDASLTPWCRSCQSLEEQLKKLVQIVDCVCADVQQAQSCYNKLFYR